MERGSPIDGGNEESAYLTRLFTEGVPRRATAAVRTRSLRPIGEAAMLVVFTFAVGLGYLWEIVSENI